MPTQGEFAHGAVAGAEAPLRFDAAAPHRDPVAALEQREHLVREKLVQVAEARVSPSLILLLDGDEVAIAQDRPGQQVLRAGDRLHAGARPDRGEARPWPRTRPPTAPNPHAPPQPPGGRPVEPPRAPRERPCLQPTIS